MVLLTAAVRGYHPAAFGEFLTYNPFERGEETMEYKLSAIAGNGDTLAVVWQEFNSPGWDINMAWSVNGSGALLNNIMVIDDGVLSQKQPDIAYHDGLFHIVYEDQVNSRVAYRIASFEPIVGTSELPTTSFSVDISPNPFLNKLFVKLTNPEREKMELN